MIGRDDLLELQSESFGARSQPNPALMMLWLKEIDVDPVDFMSIANMYAGMVALFPREEAGDATAAIWAAGFELGFRFCEARVEGRFEDD